MSDKDRIEDITAAGAPYTVFSGFCMGTADVVPGVSGGTMAVALGIYHQLLAAITSADRTALKTLFRFEIKKLFSLVHWRFLAALLTGLLLGVGVMVKVVKLPSMVVSSSPHRPLVYAVFFGMVLSSAVVLGRHIGQWSAMRGGALVVGAGVGFAVVNLVPVATPEHPLFIFLCGSIAICAMLLPGISGSFILLIMGKYAYILSAVGKLDLLVVLPFVLGCLVGLLSFSRLLKWLLDRWHDTVLASLIGLLIGSLWRIWPYQELQEVVVRHKPRVIGATPFWPKTLDVKLLVGFVAGIVFVMGIEAYASRRRKLADVKPTAEPDVG
jgi:putative membrane protein